MPFAHFIGIARIVGIILEAAGLRNAFGLSFLRSLALVRRGPFARWPDRTVFTHWHGFPPLAPRPSVVPTGMLSLPPRNPSVCRLFPTVPVRLVTWRSRSRVAPQGNVEQCSEISPPRQQQPHRVGDCVRVLADLFR